MAHDWSAARNILCICRGGVGDLLLATPALRALKQSAGGRHVGVLASPAAARAARHVPEIDEALACESAGVPEGAGAGSVLGMRRFDAAVLFAPSGSDPLPAARLCVSAAIPLSLAYGAGAGRELLSDAAAEPETPCHDALRHLQLVGRVGARTDDEQLSFRVPGEASWRARIKLEEAGVDVGRSFIVVAPGADEGEGGAPERFGEAAAKLSVALDSQVVVVAGAARRGLAERVRRAAGDRARKLAGCLTLEERAAVLELAPMLVTDDDEALHLAAAVRTPVVQVNAPGHPARAPWRVAHRVLPASPGGPAADAVVVAACDLWLDIHWRTAA